MRDVSSKHQVHHIHACQTTGQIQEQPFID
jgi:hypothetical protein